MFAPVLGRTASSVGNGYLVQSARAFVAGGAAAHPAGRWPCAPSPVCWEPHNSIPLSARSSFRAGHTGVALHGDGVPGGSGGNVVVPGEGATRIVHGRTSHSCSSSCSGSSSGSRNRAAGGSGNVGLNGPAVSGSGDVAGQQQAGGRTARYEVYRIDDNDNTFVIGVYSSRTEAEAVAKEFEERRHKQIYLVREVKGKQPLQRQPPLQQ